MSFESRKAIYDKIEAHRKRQLIVFFTSARRGAEAKIAADAVREFVDQLFALPKEAKDVDIMINSLGGDGLASWRIISLVREKIGNKGKLSVLVPHYAFSAATLIALGGDDIYMHPASCLGPIDPQITVTTKDGHKKFAYEDLVSFAEFLKEEGRLTEQPNLASLLKFLVEEISPSALGASKRSSSQSVAMAKRLLKMHMKEAEAAKADAIAEKLNKSFFSHGHAVSRQEAVELGLNISASDDELDNLIWQIYQDLEKEMEMRTPFNPLSICLSDPANAFLMNPPPTVAVPSNLPAEIMGQLWGQVLSSVRTDQCTPKDYELIQAVVESPRHRSRFVTRGRLFAARKPDMDYIVGAPQLASGWEIIDI